MYNELILAYESNDDVEAEKVYDKYHNDETEILVCFANACKFYILSIVMALIDKKLINKNKSLFSTVLSNIFKYMEKEPEKYKYLLGYIQKKLSLDKKYFIKQGLQITACVNGCLEAVKFLHEQMKLSKTEFTIKDNLPLMQACKEGHINVVKYLHKYVKLNINDFKTEDGFCARHACANGHLDVVKYLHEEVNLPISNFRSDDNYGGIWACRNGDIHMVKYLHEVIGLTKDDFKLYEYDAVIDSCKNGHLVIIEYLYEIGFTKDDFQVYDNCAYIKACEKRS